MNAIKIGNDVETAALTSEGTTLRVPQFGGIIYYVSDDHGLDTNTGTSPGSGNALKTIGAAIGKLTEGDAVSVMAGVYTETGLDLNVDYCELWFEIGAILTPATGTALTISANYCKVKCEGGSLRINPAEDQTGVLVTGVWAYLHDIRVACNSLAAIGFDIGKAATTNGSGSVLDNCRCSDPKVAAFKIQGDKIKVGNCCTGGSVAGSIGYWVTNSCDKARLSDLGCQGHSGAGYQVDTGCTNGVVRDCGSGGGDGKWTDADSAFIWSGFTYDDNLYKALALDNSHAYNLFQVTGTVEIIEMFGHVTETLVGTNTDVYFQLYSSAGSDNITKTTDADMGTAVVGSIIIKTEDPGKALKFLSAGTPVVDKTADPKKKGAILIADADQDTFIRWVCGGNDDTGGAIHFHVTWRPLTDDGFVEVV